VGIHTTLERLVSHVAVETPIIKPALRSKYGGKSSFVLPKPFQKLVQIHTGVSFKSTSGNFDEAMLFTVVVSALRRSSLILLVVELTTKQRL